MHWTSVAATNAARGSSCQPGFELELPDSVDSMSNDRWTVFTCSPQRPMVKPGETPVTVDYRTRYTKVISIDQSRTWAIPHEFFDWSDRPNAYLKTYRWSKDGRYLYLVSAYSPGVDWFGPSAYFYTSAEEVLFRLDLDIGVLKDILPYDENYYVFALSPDDRFLAFINPNENSIIHIREMATNVERQKKLCGDYALTGAFVWRSDSQAVFFASAIDGWVEGKAGISIFSISVHDMTMRTILYNDKRMLIPFHCWDDGAQYEWFHDNLLCVMSLDEASDYAFLNFLLNVRTGEVFSTPTRTPNPSTTMTSQP